MKLDDAATALAIDIAFWIEAVADKDYPIKDLGLCVYELCPKLRAIGIIQLVTEGNSEGFLHSLTRSGRAWRTYLSRAKAELPDDHHRCTGRSFALADAIASGDLTLANEIVENSPAEFRAGHEYEDDWCYGRLFQLFLNDSVDPEQIEAVVVQMEEYLEGDFHPVIDLARSIALRNQEEFDEAFQQLLDHQQLEIEKKKQNGQMPDPVVEAKRRVYVEALAWLRLAAIHGLVTKPEYEFCPSLARLPRQKPLPEDSDPQMADWLR